MPLRRWLFVFFASLYLLSTGPFMGIPDGTLMLRVSEALLQRHSLRAEPLEGWPEFGGQPRTDASGHRYTYAKFGLGLSLAALPLVAVGELLAPRLTAQDLWLLDASHGPHLQVPGRSESETPVLRELWYPTGAGDERVLALAAGWTNAFVVAAILVAFFSLGRALGYSTRAALWAALLLGVASPLWPYAREFFSEPLAALGLLGFATCGVLGLQRPKLQVAAGALLGLAALAKVVHAALFPLALLFVLGICRTRAERVRGVFRVGLGLTPVLALVVLYNVARFGTLAETGYGDEAHNWSTPFFTGLRGLLVSPGHGLLWYFPLLLVALAALPRLARRSPAVALLGLGALGALFALYARWWMWDGGWCWGPRFLVPALPLVATGLFPAVEAARTSRAWRLALGLLGTLGTAVAFNGIWVDANLYFSWLELDITARGRWVSMDDYYERVRWSWDASPLLHAWTIPHPDSLLGPATLRHPGLLTGFFALALVGLVASGRKLWPVLFAEEREADGVTPRPR